MRLAFEDNQTSCIFSCEWDLHAQKTYHANFGDSPHGDITKIDEALIPSHDILLAGFPCQPFSSIGARQGFDHPTQGTLFFDVARILKAKKTTSFLLENVPGLLTIQGGKAFTLIKTTLEELGYTIYTTVLDAANFGLPQVRKRLYIVGILNSYPTKFEFPIAKLPKVGVNTILQHDAIGYDISLKTQNNYLFKLDDGRPQIVDESSNIQVKTLVASYHKIQRLTGTFVKGGTFGLRLLSQLECKHLQGFPDAFIFPVSRTQMYRQLGNSVAVPVVSAIARQLKNYLEEASLCPLTSKLLPKSLPETPSRKASKQVV